MVCWLFVNGRKKSTAMSRAVSKHVKLQLPRGKKLACSLQSVSLMIIRLRIGDGKGINQSNANRDNGIQIVVERCDFWRKPRGRQCAKRFSSHATFSTRDKPITASQKTEEFSSFPIFRSRHWSVLTFIFLLVTRFFFSGVRGCFLEAERIGVDHIR